MRNKFIEKVVLHMVDSQEMFTFAPDDESLKQAGGSVSGVL